MTPAEPEFVTGLVAPGHDMSGFDSGEPETDNWLRANGLRVPNGRGAPVLAC